MQEDTVKTNGNLHRLYSNQDILTNIEIPLEPLVGCQGLLPKFYPAHLQPTSLAKLTASLVMMSR